MRTTTSLFFIVLLSTNGFFAALPAAEWTSREFLYQETTGVSIDSCTCLVEKLADGFHFTVSYSDEVYRFKTDANYSAVSCTVTNKITQNELVGERQASVLKLRDNNFSDEIKIGDLPWFQTAFALGQFIQAEQKAVEFFQVTTNEEAKQNRLSGSVIKMVAKKEKTERLDISGRQVETVRTTITLPGFKSMFWKITYWYRLSDGAVVRYEDVRGGPGTPATIGVLLNEEIR